MKKGILVLFLVFLSSCVGEPQEQRFVNPLFYETLQPISRTAWQTKLTPTQIISTNAGYSDIRSCELLENTQEKVVLKCPEMDNPKLIYVYTYTFDPRDERKMLAYKGILVTQKIAKPNEDWFSRSVFVIENKK